MGEVLDFIKGYKLMILKGGNNGKFEAEDNRGTAEDERGIRSQKQADIRQDDHQQQS